MTEQAENNFASINKLMAALMKARGELPLLKNDSVNDQFNHRFISLGALLKEVTPVLNQNGLQLIHFPTVSGQQAGAELLLYHESGQFLKNHLLLPIKDDHPQACGSAITYARRYSICAILGIATDKDDDASAASNCHDRVISPADGGAVQPKITRNHPRTERLNWREVVIHCGSQAGQKLGDLDDGTVLKLAQWYVPNDAKNADDMRLNDALHLADMEIRTKRRNAKLSKNAADRQQPFDWRNVVIHRGNGITGRKVGDIPKKMLPRYAAQFEMEIGNTAALTADDEVLLKALRAGVAELQQGTK